MKRGTDIEDILKHGKEVSDDEVSSALREAFGYAGKNGSVVTLSELIAARASTDTTHKLWQKSFLTHSEEHALFDNGREFVMVAHGGGLFTPERFRQSYEQGIDDSQLYVSQEEITNLLQGKLPTGENFPVYSVEEITKGISNLPHQFGVIMPYTKAQESSDILLSKGAFVNNPLVNARAGGPEHLETYFEKSHRTKNKTVKETNNEPYHEYSSIAPAPTRHYR